MTMQVTAQIYHLRHLLKEDRVLIAVDISPQQEFAMLITRRMLRNLVSALAKMVTDRAASMGAHRDTILDFEHSSSVAAALAEGHIRDENRNPEQAKELAVPLRLVQEIKVLSKKDGGASLLFSNGEQVLTLEISRDRIHVVIETFLKIAERAGWDFPSIASWLEGQKDVAVPESRTLN
jgi:hypothetical protein